MSAVGWGSAAVETCGPCEFYRLYISQKCHKKKRFKRSAFSLSNVLRFKSNVLFLIESHTVVQHFGLADQVAEERVFVALTADQFIPEVVLLHHEVL